MHFARHPKKTRKPKGATCEDSLKLLENRLHSSIDHSKRGLSGTLKQVRRRKAQYLLELGEHNLRGTVTTCPDREEITLLAHVQFALEFYSR